jgi:hypothetical protein
MSTKANPTAAEMPVTNLYIIAARAVQTHSAAVQVDLDRRAADARAANIAGHRDAAISGVSTDSPVWPVACLVASTLSIGRDDGYPAVEIPDSTRAVLRAARDAGLLTRGARDLIYVGTLGFYSDFSGLSDKATTWEADHTAWDQAKTYRAKQTASTL